MALYCRISYSVPAVGLTTRKNSATDSSITPTDLTTALLDPATVEAFKARFLSFNFGY